MSLFNFELTKMLKRRTSLFLLLATILLFPIIINVISHLSVVSEGTPEGLFPAQVAAAILLFSQSYLFLPVWIIIFAGQEFSNGHVNRVVFAKSKGYYFKSKLIYCLLITLFFSLLGAFSFLLAVMTSPFDTIQLDLVFFLRFVFQLAVSTFAFSAPLLFLVFIVRSPVIAFVIYLVWGVVESLTFAFARGIYKIEAFWLPLHLVRTFYAKNGDNKVEAYYDPFVVDVSLLIAPTIFVILIIFFTHKLFMRSDLKPLSD